MKNKICFSIFLIIMIIILSISLTGCNKKVDNSNAIIKRLNFEVTIDGQKEEYVIDKHVNYKRITEKNGSEKDYEEFYWEYPKIQKISSDLSSVGFYDWDGFKSNNKAMSNALKLKVNATLSNGSTISVSAYGDMPQNYDQVIRFLKLHFD